MVIWIYHLLVHSVTYKDKDSHPMLIVYSIHHYAITSVNGFLRDFLLL